MKPAELNEFPWFSWEFLGMKTFVPLHIVSQPTDIWGQKSWQMGGGGGRGERSHFIQESTSRWGTWRVGGGGGGRHLSKYIFKIEWNYDDRYMDFSQLYTLNVHTPSTAKNLLGFYKVFDFLNRILFPQSLIVLQSLFGGFPGKTFNMVHFLVVCGSRRILPSSLHRSVNWLQHLVFGCIVCLWFLQFPWL